MAIEIARGLSDSPALGLIEVGEDQWYDPQTNFTKLLQLEVASKLRRDLDVLERNVASSDLVVLTLGLVETWFDTRTGVVYNGLNVAARSEEHKSELPSLMRISYAVFCLTTKTITRHKLNITARR